MEACLIVLWGRGGRPEEAPVYRQVVPDLWPVSEALARIGSKLEEHSEGGDLSKFLPGIAADATNHTLRAQAAVAGTLLAGLELAREGGLTIEQDEAYGPMLFIGKQVARAGGTSDVLIG
jgi:segregation and condensation protein A